MAVAHHALTPEEFFSDVEKHACELEKNGGVEYVHLESGRSLAVLDAAQFDKWVEAFKLVQESELRMGLREAYADIEAGRIRPAKEALDELAIELGVPEQP